MPETIEVRQEGRFWRSDRFQSWLNKRMPPAQSVTLEQKSIFILPTRNGLFFVLLILLMMLAGINYQNSLIFALAFLLASLFMVSILHTYRNLSGLNLRGGTAQPAFAGEDAEFHVTLSRLGNRTYEALQIGWDVKLMQGVDLIDEATMKMRLFVPTLKRGQFNPGRLLIETNYPVGLFRAWSWVDLNMQTLVYPRPIYAGEVPKAATSNNEGEVLQRQGVDDFYGFKTYQEGDSLRHVAWKSFARTNDMFIKEFAAFVDRRIWLDWEFFPGLDREARLSCLTYWVVTLSAREDVYGLRLPGIEIEPGRGPEHRKKLLKSLALFENP